MGDEGLETIDLSTWIDNNFGQCTSQSAAESGAVGLNSLPIYPDLAKVIKAWPELSDETRGVILRLVSRG